MYWGGVTPEMLAAMQRGTYVSPASKEAKEKAEQVAADAKKTPDEKLRDGFRSCKEAGKKLPRRLLGIVDRETGKMTDQYTVMEGHEKEVSKIIMDAFLEQLDIELLERGLIVDEKQEQAR
ncbi:hypothetical protein LCGC14_0244450 [marine sediment metagenome]|uniref:Uncharacterized protein n=1 Tax=marine sediment metagenome TaxID=412755 RepID=A0A0F9XB32_9ZZZZ